MKNTLKTSGLRNINVIAALLVFVWVVFIGMVLHGTFAASEGVATEAEMAAIAPNAKLGVVIDPTAADGKALEFGKAGNTAGGGGLVPPECKVAAGQQLQDQEPIVDASIGKKGWKKPSATTEVTINFEIKALTPEHAGYIRKAAAAWSSSPCIEAKAVDTCPPGGSCVVAVQENALSGDPEVVAYFEGKYDNEGYTVGGQVVLYEDRLTTGTPADRLLVVTHEMGHAMGLGHRTTKGVLMSAYVSPDAIPQPDEIDHQNLLVLYGAKQ